MSKTKAWIILILLTTSICGLILSTFPPLPTGVVLICIAGLFLALSSK